MKGWEEEPLILFCFMFQVWGFRLLRLVFSCFYFLVFTYGSMFLKRLNCSLSVSPRANKML